MIRISRWGLSLRLISEEDLEKVRRWRNDPVVNQKMEYREPITEVQQRNWFHGLTKGRDLYFIFGKEGEEWGVVNAKRISGDPLSAEMGIFSSDKSLIGNPEGGMVVLVLMEFLARFPGVEHFRAKIGTANTNMILSNRMLGYAPEQGQDGSAFRYHEVSAERFLDCTRRLRATLCQMMGEDMRVEFSEEEEVMHSAGAGSITLRGPDLKRFP